MPSENDVELTDSEEVAKPSLRRFVDLRPEMLADAEMRHTASTLGLALGPRVSLEGLARELDLFWAPGIHVLHAQPGSGKTALRLQNRLGLSQRDVGDKCRWPRERVARAESGKHLLTLRTLMVIASAMNVSVAELLPASYFEPARSRPR